MPLNSAIRWHGWSISERRFLPRQFQWSVADKVMTQTWLFWWSFDSQWAGRDSMPVQDKDRDTSALAACLKYLFVYSVLIRSIRSFSPSQIPQQIDIAITPELIHFFWGGGGVLGGVPKAPLFSASLFTMTIPDPSK